MGRVQIGGVLARDDEQVSATDRPDVELGILENFLGFYLRLAYESAFDDFSRELGPDSLKPGNFALLSIIFENPGTVDLRAVTTFGVSVKESDNPIGYFGTGFADQMSELILARTLTAMGFAIVFVSAQGFIVDRTAPAQRARGIGLFVSAIMAAMLCGPPIGGIVADRLGDSTAFTVSAMMAIVAYVCALVALPSDGPRGTEVRRAVRLSDVRRVLAQPLMVALLVGCALPAKMLLIGVCFYILPLNLANQFEPAAIGRVLMLYGLAMLVIVPAVSRWSDEASLRMSFVVLGGIASALAVAHFFLWPQPWGAALMVLQIGIAQGISTTPQSALVGEIGKRILPDLSEGGIYGVFRLVERMGTAIGPLFVGLVWSVASPELAMVATALLVACGALLFALVWWGAPGTLKGAEPRGAEG